MITECQLQLLAQLILIVPQDQSYLNLVLVNMLIPQINVNLAQLALIVSGTNGIQGNTQLWLCMSKCFIQSNALL